MWLPTHVLIDLTLSFSNSQSPSSTGVTFRAGGVTAGRECPARFTTRPALGRVRSSRHHGHGAAGQDPGVGSRIQLFPQHRLREPGLPTGRLQAGARWLLWPTVILSRLLALESVCYTTTLPPHSQKDNAESGKHSSLKLHRCAMFLAQCPCLTREQERVRLCTSVGVHRGGLGQPQ